MRHPTDGTLRRLLDEPVAVTDADRHHIATCPVCRSAVSAAERDATWVASALGPDMSSGTALVGADDVEAAWQRLSAALTDDTRPRVETSVPLPRRRRGLSRPVIAAVGVAAVLGGASAAAAGDWLQVFRAERVAVPGATRAELVVLPEPEDLAAYGDFEVLTPQPRLREVADASAALAITRLPVPQVDDLPRGVVAQPTYQVADQVSATFTFSVERAAQTAAESGEALPSPPEGLDGNRFRLVAGPAHATVWPEGRGLPAMVVARAVAPTVYSAGVPFETAVDYLVSLPGLPEDTASTLADFTGDGTTLPLPFAADEVTSETADVAGIEATLVTSRDGLAAGVVWVDDGVITAVAGTLSGDEVLAVARGLRDR